MWSVFILIYFSLQLSSASENLTARTDILLILDHPKLLNLDEERSSVDLKFDVCFEWESKNKKETTRSRELTSWNELDEFGIVTENLVVTRLAKSIVRREKSSQSVRSNRFVTLYSDKPLDFSGYPDDIHLFQLRFTSTLINSSQLTLNPHFVMSTKDEEYSQWKFEISKSFVQWVVHKNESFEQAIFEIRISRNNSPSVRICLFLIFLLNVTLIFDHFPLSKISGNRNSSNLFLCCEVVVVAIAGIFISPRTGYLNSFSYQLFSLLLLGIIAEILHQILPFLIFHLRCCPIESDPFPQLYPSPSEQFSLDTERSKCNAALDSARAESMRSPRIANFDMCLAEVKFTMTTLNEVLNLHSSAEWRRKLWHNAYRRFEVLAFIILQIINLVLFTSYCQ